MSKALALALVLVFLAASSTILTMHTVKAETKTITVPDDYSSISDAIGVASQGDTIFVKT